MRRLVLLSLLAAATAHAGTPPSAPATLDYKDFWTVAGVSRTDTPATLAKRWGAKATATTADGETTVRYARGPSVNFRADGAIQLNLSDLDTEFLAAFGDGKTSLIGRTCKDAGARLAFFKKPIPRYLTCKRYDQNNWLVDVTLMCRDKVSLLTVVWVPLPKSDKPYNDQHCNE